MIGEGGQGFLESKLQQLEAENKILKEFILVYNEMIETLARLRIVDSVLQEQTKKPGQNHNIPIGLN